jgi:hypothetical protein
LQRVREGKMTGNRMRFTAAHFLGTASMVPVIGSFQTTTWWCRWLARDARLEAVQPPIFVPIP